MFQIGDILIYGTQGICKVGSIGPLPMPGVDPTRQYYTLHPYYQQELVIYAPVDNQSVVMRPPLTRQEAEGLIAEMPTLEAIWVPNEKERETQYRAALNSCDCRELVRIIKTLHHRRSDRMQHGKKGTAIDEKYFHLAEEQLYGELAYVLGRTKEEMPDYIASCIEHEAENPA